jgi:hypothetical protein
MKAPQDRKAPKGIRVNPDHRDQSDPQDTKAIQVRQAPPDLRVPRVIRANQDHKAPWDHVEHEDRVVIQGNQANPSRWATIDTLTNIALSSVSS